MCTHPILLWFPFFRCTAIGCMMMGAVGCAWSQSQSVAEKAEEWKKTLEQKGFIDRSLPSPYRVAVPLANFGDHDHGPKLMFTYTPSTKAPTIFFKLELK